MHELTALSKGTPSLEKAMKKKDLDAVRNSRIWDSVGHPHTRTPARPHTRTPARPHSRTPAHPHTRTPIYVKAHPHPLSPLLPPHPTPPRPAPSRQVMADRSDERLREIQQRQEARVREVGALGPDITHH